MNPGGSVGLARYPFGDQITGLSTDEVRGSERVGSDIPADQQRRWGRPRSTMIRVRPPVYTGLRASSAGDKYRGRSQECGRYPRHQSRWRNEMTTEQGKSRSGEALRATVGVVLFVVWAVLTFLWFYDAVHALVYGEPGPAIKAVVCAPADAPARGHGGPGGGRHRPLERPVPRAPDVRPRGLARRPSAVRSADRYSGNPARRAGTRSPSPSCRPRSPEPWPSRSSTLS